MPTTRRLVFGLLLTAACTAQADPDGDGDGLSDFQEVHKYRTDPRRADSDGDGVPDGDWFERREYQYTVRTIVQVMRPVTPEWLCDDHQDARVLDQTDTWVELEVVHYPFTTVAAAIEADPEWREHTAALGDWLRPGPTSDWTPALRERLLAALAKGGIDATVLDDKTLVERASSWLCRRAKGNDCFTTFATAFDEHGEPFVPDELLPALGGDRGEYAKQWPRDLSATGMFDHAVRGSCSSSAIYLSGCLRALGVPTRTILTIPVIDAGDDRELELVERGMRHHALRGQVLDTMRKLRRSWSSHTFNEVFVGGRWRRLDCDHLGQDIASPDRFGLLTHVATFHDWADARMAETIGRRQTLRQNDDLFGGANPYSTIALRDEFGPHCKLENPPLQVTVVAVEWGDARDTPDDVRTWFARNGQFGAVVCVEGLRDAAALQSFLAVADLRVQLAAAERPTLGVAVDPRCWWWKNDVAWIVVPFGPADRRDHVADASYRFEPRNAAAGASWRVRDGVELAPRR